MPDISPVPASDLPDEHARLADHLAHRAIARHAGSPFHAAVMHRILSAIMDRGNCSAALELPALVNAGVNSPTSPPPHLLSASLTLLEAGIYALDHLLDDEVEGDLASMRKNQMLMGSISLISHLPAQMMLEFPISAARKTKMLRLYASGLSRIGAGQLEDLASLTISEQQSAAIKRVVLLKTGERRALFCELAAVFAGAPSREVEAYAAYGRSLGIARQVRSDLLDIFGERPSRDLASGVTTLPLVVYRETANRTERRELDRILAGRWGGNPAGHSRQTSRERNAPEGSRLCGG